MIKVETIRLLKDNYCYLLTDAKTGTRGVVDAGSSEEIIAYIEKIGGGLDWVLLTHHHFDHVNGIQKLREHFGLKVVGSERERMLSPPMDVGLESGEVFKLGESSAKIIDVRGHTMGHIAFYFEEDKSLFSGDALFSLGCGRLFEGTAKEAWEGLLRMRQLPADTKVWFGHEYTLDNAEFALKIDGDNESLKSYIANFEKMQQAGKQTAPVLMGDEAKHNPFLRGDDPAMAKQMGMENAEPFEVFGKIRSEKDAFTPKKPY